MNAELKNFLTRIYAGPEVLDRLATTGAKTLEEAWAPRSIYRLRLYLIGCRTNITLKFLFIMNLGG